MGLAYCNRVPTDLESPGINLVWESRGILLVVGKRCVLSELHDCLRWKEVGVEVPTKSYINLVLEPQMGQGIVAINSQGLSFLKLSGNPML